MGPLAGLKIIELVGIGPGPFCGMMLADQGAEIVAIDRAGTPSPLDGKDPTKRNRRSVVLDLKTPAGLEVLLRLVDGADALFEGFRPGVAERLGFGPDVCLARNPRLVYGRMTGWGQTGPLAKVAGHDLDYIALTGALHAIGRKGDKPVPPLNLIGDYGGGAMLLAFGMVCALFEAQRSGRGQVVDAAIVDGAASLMAMFFGLQAMGLWSDGVGETMLAGAAHFYDTYETKDGGFLAVAPIEAKFYAELIERLELDPGAMGVDSGRNHLSPPDEASWDDLKEKLAALFKTRTRDEWCALLEGTDACVAPVLTLSEAPEHPHNKARETFIEVDGVVQPAPAPRFSRTPAGRPKAPPPTGADRDSVLADWGAGEEEIARWRKAGAFGDLSARASGPGPHVQSHGSDLSYPATSKEIDR